MFKTVYQTSRSRFFWGLGLSLLLHILVLGAMQLMGIQRTSVPEYAGIVFIELADFDYDSDEMSPVDPVDDPVHELSPDLQPEEADQPPPQTEVAPEPEAAQPQPSPPVQPAPSAPPEEPEEQLEFQYQEPVPDATLVQPDTSVDAAPPDSNSQITVPDGPTEAEIAFRRENLESFQSWLDEQPDLSAPPSASQNEVQTTASTLSDERLTQIDRILSQLTGPQQQVRSINVSESDSPDSGDQDGIVPSLGGDRVRISGADPVLGATVLRSTDPPILTAMVSFIVDASGRVLDLQFEKSSGNNEIDARIRSAVLSWRFTPVPNARNARGEITYTIRRVQ